MLSADNIGRIGRSQRRELLAGMQVGLCVLRVPIIVVCDGHG